MEHVVVVRSREVEDGGEVRRVQRRTVPDREIRIESARRQSGLTLMQQMVTMSASAKVGVPKLTSWESWWPCQSGGKVVIAAARTQTEDTLAVKAVGRSPYKRWMDLQRGCELLPGRGQ